MIKILKTEKRYVTFLNGSENTECRISYTGNHAWRLQTKNACGVFEDVGASQALERALKEKVDRTPGALTRKTGNGTLKLTAEDGSFVRLRLATGVLEFYGVSGKLALTVTELANTEEGSVIVGKLAPNEGVFGGGERFNTSNHRGKLLDLYSSDGWNNDNTTYVTIPMFAFSSGAGFFVNRYDRMSADLGSTDPEHWSVKILHAPMDCYLYPTDRIGDVIAGYTELSGHAGLPKPWMQGVMVCRYGPDFSTYDKDRTDRTTNPDGAPSGRCVVNIVENFLKAGLKPEAVILENWDWRNMTDGSEYANDRLAQTKGAVAYCHERGIKLMVYMRAGAISPTMKGFRDDYRLWANICQKDLDGSETVTRTCEIPRTSSIGNPDAARSATFNYIDITNPKAMKWYLDSVWDQMIELGVDGIKIDFCEDLPDTGVVYTMSRTGEAIGERTVTYEWYNPKMIPAGGEHHFYPTYFISAYYRRMNELKAEKLLDDGFVVLSRGGGIGSQRNPYMWAGDQVRMFCKLKSQMVSAVSSGLSGIPFMTYDMAGYRYHRVDFPYADTEENRVQESLVFARAVEMTAFTTNIQTHGTVRNVYELIPETRKTYGIYTELHRALIPYIQELSVEACRSGMPVVRHPVLHAPKDANVWGIDDQFMLGDAFLSAPELKGELSRDIYLPAGDWKDLNTGRTYHVVRGKYLKNYRVKMSALPVFLNLNTASETALAAVEPVTALLAKARRISFHIEA